jgi:hypothetical protein
LFRVGLLPDGGRQPAFETSYAAGTNTDFSESGLDIMCANSSSSVTAFSLRLKHQQIPRNQNGIYDQRIGAGDNIIGHDSQS